MAERRGIALCAALLVLAALLGGCSRPARPGLAGSWSKMPAPVSIVPAVGACYDVAVDSQHTDPALPPRPVGCDLPHTLRTVHVGSFTGADATNPVAPLAGDPRRSKAYAECMRAANGYLGADWRTGWAQVLLATPPVGGWGGGARWFRCDLAETNDGSTALRRTGTMQGALAGAAPLAYRCGTATPVSGGVPALARTDCAATHNLEFAGLYEVPAQPYPESDDANDAVGRPGCLPKIAQFAHVPAKDVNYRTGWWFMTYSRGAWELGNHGMRCFIYSEKPRTGSLAGAGPKALPLH